MVNAATILLSLHGGLVPGKKISYVSEHSNKVVN